MSKTMTCGEVSVTVDLHQGDTPMGGEYRAFGYVCGDEGGFFYTWMDTLDATLATVEGDEVDGDGGLVKEDVVALLREYLPTTARGRKMWGTDDAE